MDFAIVRISGKQYLVNPSQKLEIEGRIADGQKELTVSEVLLLNVGNDLKIGTPLVSGAKIKAQIVETGKGEKIRVSKFKAKSRYRRTTGFRPFVTTLQFEDFGSKKK